MSTDPLERLEKPEYTGENRCTPCTVVNLLLAVAVATLAGRRNRALGLVVFLGSAALIYLRGYLVPGTPELTKRYLPASVLARFGKADRPETVPDEVARAAERRAREAEAPGALDESDDDEASGEPTPGGEEAETVEAVTDGAVPAETSEAAPDGTATTEDDAIDAAETSDPADAPGTDDPEDDPELYAHREEVEELLGEPMDVVLEGFDVVEPGDGDGEDIVLVESFREAWVSTIDLLEGDDDERLETLADLFHESEAAVELERRDDDRLYGLVDGKSRSNWISEAALLADLAAHRVLASRDPRWSAVVPEERFSILKGFRVFLETCPLCGGPVEPTDEAVESCCDTWEVIAVRCLDCEARVLEVTPPESSPGGDGAAATGAPGRFTR